MKRYATLATTFAAVIGLTLAGCSSQLKTNASGVPVSIVAAEECKFPGTTSKAPGWVCDEDVPGLALSAAGVSEKTPAGYAFMKDMATADARAQLAAKLSVHVSSLVKRYAQTVGTEKRQVVDQVNTSATAQQTSVTLAGSKVIRTMTGPDGRLWVLVGIDAESLALIDQTSTAAADNATKAQRARAAAAMGELMPAREAATATSSPGLTN